MNKGYIMQAEAYKTLADQGQISKEEADKKRAVYAFLGTIDNDQLYDLFDSGAFNSIVKSYIRLALKNTETDEKTAEGIMQELRRLFDTNGAKEVDKG